ncbi:MAG: DMT family transporter, partial [Alphaproteobacteria bacterium]|nr:DMT family transporter [Alphaproteobacteria bacterium]
GLVGNGLILLAALCWAVSIVYVRAHRWISAPFQLVFWQSLLASAILTAMALVVEGPPKIEWTPTITAGFLYGGFVGNALAYWAMTMVNRSLPAVTTSLGILGTPVVGVIVSMMALGEPLSVYVVVAMLLIIGGIALGTIPRKEAGNHRLVVGRAK